MHTHLHRTPQPNTFPSFNSKNTPRMVREPHRTHGNKTRISSFTDSRTTICALCHTPTPMSTLSPLVFRCPFHTIAQNNHPLQRASPGHTCHGVTPGPCMSYPHRLLPNTAPTPKCLSCVSSDRISGYTPRARPRAFTGLRLSAGGSHHTCFPGRTYGCQ